MVLSIGIWQIIILFLVIAGIVLPILAVIGIVKNDFKGKNDKIIWILIVVFLNIIGFLFYFMIGRTQKIDNSEDLSSYQ